MPYIIQKRSDIAAGVLQTLDLQPNTSIREEAYKPHGQTAYRIVPPVATVALTNAAGTITFTNAAEGLAAWFLTNVANGGAVAASGVLTGALNFADTETVTIGAKVYTFQAVLTNVDGNVLVGGTLAASIQNLLNAINLGAGAGVAYAAATTAHPSVTATGSTGTTLTVTAITVGTAGNSIATTETAANAAWGAATLAGGVDAAALTAAQADQNVTDILGLLGWNVAGAATALNLAAINGAITTGTILAADVASILDILAGRQYLVPAGVQIETGAAFTVSPAVGVTGGPNFDVDAGFRRIYEAGSLRISFNEGRLSRWADNAYVFGGNTGAAVAVYNDDGTLYTGA
jgi:hypothetical protein